MRIAARRMARRSINRARFVLTSEPVLWGALVLLTIALFVACSQ
jgi:hypothetical protein